MVPFPSLWLSIVLAAVLVFVASSVIHMLLRYHASDFQSLPQEDAVGTAIRDANVPPGDYVMPYAGSMKAMSSPEFIERMKRGPVAQITVRRPGPVPMGQILALWFLLILAVTIFAGYLASRAAAPGADLAHVFRMASTTAFAAYGLGTWTESIWFGRKWSTTVKNTVDALVYALITGAIFAWLWPGA